jgi:hypothetical protein
MQHCQDNHLHKLAITQRPAPVVYTYTWSYKYIPTIWVMVANDIVEHRTAVLQNLYVLCLSLRWPGLHQGGMIQPSA